MMQGSDSSHIQLWGAVVNRAIEDLLGTCWFFCGKRRSKKGRNDWVAMGSSAAWFLFGSDTGIDIMFDDQTVQYIRRVVLNQGRVASDGRSLTYRFEYTAAEREMLLRVIEEIRGIECQRRRN